MNQIGAAAKAEAENAGSFTWEISQFSRGISQLIQYVIKFVVPDEKTICRFN
jgi:hypothetical protein